MNKENFILNVNELNALFTDAFNGNRAFDSSKAHRLLDDIEFCIKMQNGEYD